MKLAVNCKDQSYRVELRERDTTARGPSFEISVSGSGQETRLPVRILSRVRERWTLEIDGRIEDVLISEVGGEIIVQWHNRSFPIRVGNVKQVARHPSAATERAGPTALQAQMPGKVITVLAARGDMVEKGQGLVIIEAMKMQNELKSPCSGKVITCNVEPEKRVNMGELLFEIE